MDLWQDSRNDEGGIMGLRELNRQKWLQHIKNHENSNLNETEYCEKNNLKVRAFREWQIKSQINAVKINEEKSAFVEISKEDLSVLQPKENYFDITFNDSIKIRITKYFDSELLLRLLRILEDI
jgi:hypothetical protein